MIRQSSKKSIQHCSEKLGVLDLNATPFRTISSYLPTQKGVYGTKRVNTGEKSKTIARLILLTGREDILQRYGASKSSGKIRHIYVSQTI
jgi:hypothetical protein